MREDILCWSFCVMFSVIIDNVLVCGMLSEGSSQAPRPGSCDFEPAATEYRVIEIGSEAHQLTTSILQGEENSS